MSFNRPSPKSSAASCASRPKRRENVSFHPDASAAEAAGFRLAPSGRFECVHEDDGAVLYTLQGVRGEPFSAALPTRDF